jgi:hypothetical protein
LVKIVAVSAVVALLALAPPPASAVDREGFLIGVGLSGGRIDCTGCTSTAALGLQLHLGGSFSKRVALVADVFVLGRSEEGTDLSTISLAATGLYWVTPRLFLGLGLGVGSNMIDTGNVTTSSETSFAFTVQAGFEIVQRRSFVLDVRSRYDRIPDLDMDNVALGLAVSWY